PRFFLRVLAKSKERLGTAGLSPAHKNALRLIRQHEASVLDRSAERAVPAPVAADAGERQKNVFCKGDHPVLHTIRFLLYRLKTGGRGGIPAGTRHCRMAFI